jgi:hypothetical protein
MISECLDIRTYILAGGLGGEVSRRRPLRSGGEGVEARGVNGIGNITLMNGEGNSEIGDNLSEKI